MMNPLGNTGNPRAMPGTGQYNHLPAGVRLQIGYRSVDHVLIPQKLHLKEPVKLFVGVRMGVEYSFQVISVNSVRGNPDLRKLALPLCRQPIDTFGRNLVYQL